MERQQPPSWPPPPHRSEPELPPLRYGPPKQSTGALLKKIFGPILLVLVFALKWLGKIKFLILPLLKFGHMILATGGSMFVSIWAYSWIFGWWFALGFVVLILVHEAGHLIAARMLGLRVGAPVFIPFLGAFIALKDAPRNAWIEALVGIGGPLLGGLGCIAAYGIFVATGQPIFAALASTGCTLNLLNLIPVGFLDGGRIAAAISPRLWLVGFGLLLALMIVQFPFIHPLLIAITIFSVPRFVSLFRKKTLQEERYFEVSPRRRLLMGVSYFGLAAVLALGAVLFQVRQ